MQQQSRIRGALILGAALVLTLWWACGNPGPPSGIQVYTARNILTMDPALPRANAVAVEAGRIIAVGRLDTVLEQLGETPHLVDDRFASRVILPGFIDPHIHPSLAGAILPMDIVSAMAWATPRGRTRPVRGHDAFLQRLSELDAQRDDPEAWLTAWGYHAPYHGSLSRADLDSISQTRPIMVWQRSVHEMYFNSAALTALDLSEADFAAVEQSDWETGHIWEAGLFKLGEPMIQIIASPGNYRAGLSMMTEVLHRGGLTTVGEQGFPQTGPMAEALMLWLEMRSNDTPYRFVLVPNAMYLLREHGSAGAALAEARGWLERSTRNIEVIKHVKYYADGAIFSQLMQMSEPYLDGHHGEWMMTPEQQREVLEVFWRDGWDIHVHVNGDAGLDLVLDQLEAVRTKDPQPDRRVFMEHYGYARPDQHARLNAMQGSVSNNAYYLHELAPIYAEHGLGAERAANISPLGDLARAGVPISFHSDFPMAPAEPLVQIWVAVNRVASDGQVWGEDQRLALDLALRAATLEAARSLGMQDEIGSIEVGKRADFTILAADPSQVDPLKIKDIEVIGTVLDGRIHLLDSAY